MCTQKTNGLQIQLWTSPSQAKSRSLSRLLKVAALVTELSKRALFESHTGQVRWVSGKGSCLQACWPAFHPEDTRGGKNQLPQVVLSPSHMHEYVHTHRNTCNKNSKVFLIFRTAFLKASQIYSLQSKTDLPSLLGSFPSTVLSGRDSQVSRIKHTSGWPVLPLLPLPPNS